MLKRLARDTMIYGFGHASQQILALVTLPIFARLLSPGEPITVVIDDTLLADLVVGDGEGWLTELSSGDLRKVFALSDGAIGE